MMPGHAGRQALGYARVPAEFLEDNTRDVAPLLCPPWGSGEGFCEKDAPA
jgi:hypothetical protein